MNDVKKEIEKRLQHAFQPKQLEIIDESYKHQGHVGARSGGHFCVTIVSESFAALKPLERHRKINAVLADLFQVSIHALSIQAYSPAERIQSTHESTHEAKNSK